MSPEERERWQAASALMRAWQDCAPEGRAAWWTEQSIAPDVEAILRRLLQADATPDPRLDATPDTLDGGLAGRRVGDWELIEQIGRGGMARVFRARRHGSDYEQQVAVKLLPQALRDPDQQRRFQRERQILARLRHPGIAGLIDGGVAPGGTAFLVLQLVDGERIDAWCEQQGLDARGRVRLLLEVCDAVAYAHRQLVVHRDLKPGNVMVERSGRALLLDFGIARLVDEAQGAADTVTRAFTPEYAAPEQQRGDAAIGTSVDVYGLGALAHRLLADRPPQRDADGEVALPSQLSGVEPAAAQRLRGDLDAILMRALAAAPERRYAGVDAFAADLRAWLEQRPVRARAPRLGYRTGKWLRRHRTAAAAAVLLLLALAAGVGATLWQALAAQQQAQRAERVLGFLDEALKELVPSSAGVAANADRRAMLERLAAQGRREFADDPIARAEVLHRLALQYDRIGAMRDAHAATAEAVAALAQSVPESDVRLALRRADEALLAHRVGGYDQAERERIEAAFQRATSALVRADARDELARVLLSHSSVASDQSRSDEAMRLLEHARTLAARGDDAELRADVDSRYAQVLQRLGRWQDLAGLQREALRRAREAHGEEHEDVGRALFGLAVATSNLGRRGEGAAMMERAIALLDRIFPEGNQRLQNVLPLAVNVYDRAGRSGDALAIARRNLDAARAMYGERNLQTGTALATLGRMLLARGELDDAEARTREALAIYLDALGPDSDFVAIARHYLANVLSAAGRPAQAHEQRVLARVVAARVDGEDSLLHARVLSGLGGDLLQLGRVEEALAAHRQAVALFQRHGDRSGQLEQARLAFAEALREHGDHAAARSQLALTGRHILDDPEAPAAVRRHFALVQAEVECLPPGDGCAAAKDRLHRLPSPAAHERTAAWTRRNAILADDR